MKKNLALAVSIVFIGSFLTSPAFGAVKAGATCAKVGSTSIVSGKKFTCVKTSKKLVWDSGSLIVKPTDTTSPTNSEGSKPVPSQAPKPAFVDLSFENLIANQENISYTAWKRVSDTIASSSSKAGDLSVFTGPNTQVYFDNIANSISLVSKLFPNKSEAKEILWIRYKYSDIQWAENKAKEILSPTDYAQIARYQGGSLSQSNCDASSGNCRGSYQQTGPSGAAVIMQGIENTPPSDDISKSRMTTGMLEAHEYFHSLQRIPIMNTGVQVWPHAWWREGSAEWVQNVVVNSSSYEKYKKFLLDDSSYSCKPLSESDISEFLNTAYDNYVPPKFDSWLNYSLGSHVIEILVAIKGPGVLIDMYSEVGKGKTFNEAFNSLFGLSWSEAVPIISKSIFKDLHSGG
jgi:hypothetical protein